MGFPILHSKPYQNATKFPFPLGGAKASPEGLRNTPRQTERMYVFGAP